MRSEVSSILKYKGSKAGHTQKQRHQHLGEGRGSAGGHLSCSGSSSGWAYAATTPLLQGKSLPGRVWKSWGQLAQGNGDSRGQNGF